MEKKTILFCTLSFCLLLSGRAQTFNEWFRQAKTQKEYLLKQIAAYQNYLGYLKKGYVVVRNGSKIIEDSKANDYQEHSAYFKKLSEVSASIRNSKKVVEIIRLAESITPIATRAMQATNHSLSLTVEESQYIRSVFSHLLQQCYGVLEALQNLIKSDKMRLSDGERIDAINQLYTDMQVKYTFCVSLNSEVHQLGMNRSLYEKDNQSAKKLNGLDK